MTKQTVDPMTLLSLLESSQSAVESSDQALRAAEAALSAAQDANKQAKEALKAVTEAFVLANRKLGMGRLSETEQHSGMRPSNLNNQSDEDSDDMQNFMMLSTNKNPVNDIEDDSSEAEDSFCFYNNYIPKFILISSKGPTAENQSDKMGLYRLSDEMREGRSVYIQEQDHEYDDSPCELFSVKGGWVVTWLGNLYMIATSLSKSPTSVKWQYFQWDDNTWRDDQTLTVTGFYFNKRPSGCEVRISLREDISSDIVEPGVAGVYKSDGSYHRGRPVLRHSGFTLCVWDGVWEVSSGFGGEAYLWGGVASGLLPADTKNRDWEYDSLKGCINKSNGISVSCIAMM